MIYVTDTHPLVWYFEKNKALSKKAESVFDSGELHIVIPSLVMVEVKFLIKRKKIKIDFDEINNVIANDPKFTIYPLDLQIVEKAPLNLNIHDAIICATALVYKDVLNEAVCLITKDSEIKNSQLVEICW